MRLHIAADGTLSLREVDDLKRFSIVEEASAPGTALSALAGIAEPAEADHYWLSAEAIISLSPRADDRQWVEAFWSMLRKVEPYGYADLAGKRVKAHVEAGGA